MRLEQAAKDYSYSNSHLNESHSYLLPEVSRILASVDCGAGRHIGHFDAIPRVFQEPRARTVRSNGSSFHSSLGWRAHQVLLHQNVIRSSFRSRFLEHPLCACRAHTALRQVDDCDCYKNRAESLSVLLLGLNAYHGDASACLVRDGKLVAAAEEERFRRIKHWAGFPSEAIRYCLDEGGIALRDVDHVAINQDSRSNVWRKLAYSLTHKPKLGLIAERMKKRKKRMRISEELESAFPRQTFRGETYAIDHHRAHLGSAFLVSPFEDAAVASVDGFGDFASAAWGVGRGSDIRVDDSVYFPHSLGS